MMQAPWGLRPTTPAGRAAIVALLGMPAIFLLQLAFPRESFILPAGFGILAFWAFGEILLWYYRHVVRGDRNVKRFRIEQGECPNCSYNMQGSIDRECPECGWRRNHD